MQNDIDKDGTATSDGRLQQQELPVCMSSPYRLRLRAKTPSQFPTELASLEQKLDGVEERLELVRKGRGLFKLMRDREMEKVEGTCVCQWSGKQSPQIFVITVGIRRKAYCSDGGGSQTKCLGRTRYKFTSLTLRYCHKCKWNSII